MTWNQRGWWRKKHQHHHPGTVQTTTTTAHTHTTNKTMIYSDMNYHVFLRWQNTSVSRVDFNICSCPCPFCWHLSCVIAFKPFININRYKYLRTCIQLNHSSHHHKNAIHEPFIIIIRRALVFSLLHSKVLSSSLNFHPFVCYVRRSSCVFKFK